jgi:hypothetical protein
MITIVSSSLNAVRTKLYIESLYVVILLLEILFQSFIIVLSLPYRATSYLFRDGTYSFGNMVMPGLCKYFVIVTLQITYSDDSKTNEKYLSGYNRKSKCSI